MEETGNTYFTQLYNCYVIIENVSCYKCKQWPEVYYKANVLEKIEKVASKFFIMDYNQVA